MTAKKTTTGAQPTSNTTKPATPPKGGSGVTPPASTDSPTIRLMTNMTPVKFGHPGQLATAIRHAAELDRPIEIDGTWYAITITDNPGH